MLYSIEQFKHQLPFPSCRCAGVTNLSLSAGKFVPLTSVTTPSSSGTLHSYLQPQLTSPTYTRRDTKTESKELSEPSGSNLTLSSMPQTISHTHAHTDTGTAGKVLSDSSGSNSTLHGMHAVCTRAPSIRKYFHTNPTPTQSPPSAKRLRRDCEREHQLQHPKKGEESSWEGQYPEEVVEECVVCGRHIPVWELNEHRDYHLALQLQEQQEREEEQERGEGGVVRLLRKRTGSGSTKYKSYVHTKYKTKSGSGAITNFFP